MATRDVPDEPQLSCLSFPPWYLTLLISKYSKAGFLLFPFSGINISTNQRQNSCGCLSCFLAFLSEMQAFAQLSPSVALATGTLYVNVFSLSEPVSSFLLKEENGDFTSLFGFDKNQWYLSCC